MMLGVTRPVAEVDLEGTAAALGVHGVVVVPDGSRIADRASADRARGRAGRDRRIKGRLAVPGREGAYSVDDTRTGIGAVDVVDVSGVLLVPADEAHRGVAGQRDVDESLELIALAAMIDRVAFQVVAAGERLRIGLVGDDADGARFRTRAINVPCGPDSASIRWMS